MKKDHAITTRISGDDAEILDQLARMQHSSHAEIVRRSIRLLAVQCGLDPRRPGTPHWAIRE
jgi:predicted transcriptional regulator